MGDALLDGGELTYSRRFQLRAGAIVEASALRGDLLRDGWTSRSWAIERNRSRAHFHLRELGEPTSNAAERALRTAVQWRKIMLGHTR